MKKILSILFAFVLAFSLCTIAFAEDDTTVASDDTSAVLGLGSPSGLSLSDLSAILSTFTSQISLSDFQSTITNALSTFGVPNIGSLDTSAIPGFVDTVMNQLAGLGLDVNGIKAQLSSNQLLNFFASIYMGGTTPATTTAAPVTTTEKIPNTGTEAFGGIAIFATLSIAAAAAFVSSKKEA